LRRKLADTNVRVKAIRSRCATWTKRLTELEKAAESVELPGRR
jgi:hypothetical protein